MNEHSKQGADHSRRGRSLALLVVAVLIVLAGAIAGAVIVPRLPPPQGSTPSHSPLGRVAPGSRSAATLARNLPFMRGICWEAAGRVEPSDLEPLTRIRASWISQTPFGWQRELDSPLIVTSSGSGGYWGESDAGLEATTRWAHERGIHVLLKPHVWTRAG